MYLPETEMKMLRIKLMRTNAVKTDIKYKTDFSSEMMKLKADPTLTQTRRGAYTHYDN